MRKLVLLLLVFSMSLQAQEKLSQKEKERREKNIQLGNPFKKFGYKAKVATLSKGKYLEFHDLDSIVTIGTVRLHVNKNLIVGRIELDSLNPNQQPIGDRVGRWMSPDPLSEEFPSWSPYNMCYGNPVKFVDPDGKAPTDWWKSNKTGKYVWYNQPSDGALVVAGHAYVGESINDVNNDFDNSNNFFVRNFSSPKFGDNGEKWQGEIQSDPETTLDRYAHSENIVKKGAYDLVDQPFVTFQSFNPFDQNLQHLNGDGVSPKEKLESGVQTISSLLPAPKSEFTLLKSLNAPQFSKLFKGTFISDLKPGVRGFLNRNLNKVIKKASNEAVLMNTSVKAAKIINEEVKKEP